MILPSERATQVVEQRAGQYGHPADVYEIWSHLIEPIVGTKLKPEQCSMMMVLLKCAREINAPGHADNLIDICGFANVTELIYQRRAEDGSSTASG